jgi:hypothetical protein
VYFFQVQTTIKGKPPVIAEGRRHRAEGRRQKLSKSRVSTIKNVPITLAVAIEVRMRNGFAHSDF